MSSVPYRFEKLSLKIVEDELLYDLVQNQIFDPNLKECRESILKQMSEA